MVKAVPLGTLRELCRQQLSERQIVAALATQGFKVCRSTVHNRLLQLLSVKHILAFNPAYQLFDPTETVGNTMC